MEVNKEEAHRCLSIAQKHRTSGNLPTSLKFAKKSVSLYETPEGNALVSIIVREIRVSATTSAGSSSDNHNGSASNGGPSTPTADAGSSARASGVEEHVTSAHQRPGHASSGTSTAGTSTSTGGGEKVKKREYTVKQLEVVKRVKSCQHHQYYEILAGKPGSCSRSFREVLGKLRALLERS